MTDRDIQHLPRCLGYLEEPYLLTTDEELVAALLSDAERNGIKGVSQIYTALVPLERVEDVLKSQGGIGWEVKSWGPFSVIQDNDVYKTNFWIDGPDGQKFEPLVVGWNNHNRTVMVPDNGFLITYGLSPRLVSSNDKIIWDDLSKPMYDVVSVKPLSKYSVPSRHSGAEVRINRKYAEDFASLKKCTLVAVFYEERWFREDEELTKLLSGQKGASFVLPGKRLDIILNRHRAETHYVCRIWGCRLILIPSERPITDEEDPELVWPGDTQVMTYEHAMQSSLADYVYVKDQVLSLFEKKPEFEVNPNLGDVSYEGQWALSFCSRVGRDFIAYELKKLYQGCPPHIIEHVHRFAVEERIAERQRDEQGDANIGNRANKLINEYLLFTKVIAALGSEFGLVLEDSDIGTLSKEEVEYHGCWRLDELKHLGWVAPLEMPEAEFLERCKELYKLLEKPLRRILIQIGVTQEKIKEYRSLKLLAVLMQLIYLANETGLSLKNDSKQLCERLDEDPRFESISYLFALNNLRVVDSHAMSAQNNEKCNKALETYGIDKAVMNNGWGRALDQIYDKLGLALSDLREMVSRAL